jgi:hypothetical protein
MAREQTPIRLRETKAAPRRRGVVIDAHFTVVRRRKVVRMIGTGVAAVLCAAAIGFLIPPVWMLIERLGPLH